MTYNVHRCVGPGGGDSIADITSVCRDAAADIIALQELDAPETDQDEGAHHARDLATALGMELMFCRTFRRGVGYYGHALLSRHKLELKKVTTFASPHVDAEPRGAIWARAFGFVALIFACVNIFGGFLVTQRMLEMFKKKEPKARQDSTTEAK